MTMWSCRLLRFSCVALCSANRSLWSVATRRLSNISGLRMTCHCRVYISPKKVEWLFLQVSGTTRASFLGMLNLFWYSKPEGLILYPPPPTVNYYLILKLMKKRYTNHFKNKYLRFNKNISIIVLVSRL